MRVREWSEEKRGLCGLFIVATERKLAVMSGSESNAKWFGYWNCSRILYFASPFSFNSFYRLSSGGPIFKPGYPF